LFRRCKGGLGRSSEEEFTARHPACVKEIGRLRMDAAA
jgi:hypothetical protein